MSIDDLSVSVCLHDDSLSKGLSAAPSCAAPGDTDSVTDSLIFQNEPGRCCVDSICTLVGQDTDAGLRELRYGYARTEEGLWLAAATDQGICAIDRAPVQNALPGLFELWQPARATRDDAFARQVVTQTIAGSVTDRALHLRGTAFQLAVWQLLLKIPAGRYTHYAVVARWLAKPGAARAVGSAVGANRIAVLVPCHRVLPASGAPGDYRWGRALKRRLLEREAALYPH